MKKVIYDISILGKGHQDEASRTGIYRVAEEILIQLLQSTSIDVYFVASQLNIIACKEYLRVKFPSKDLVNKFIPFDDTVNISNRLFYFLYLSLSKLNKIFPRANIVKKVLNHYGTIFQYIGIKIKYINNLGEYDAFFSPYNMLPLQVCKSKIKKIILIHDLIPIILPESTNSLAKLLQVALIKHFPLDALVICNSETTKKDLLNYRSGLLSNNIEVIYFGAAEIFQPKTQLEDNNIKNSLLPNVKKYILSVSSLNPRKNFLHVINSFLDFIQTYNVDDLYLVIVGPKGWEYQEIYAKLANIGKYKDKIIMTGYVDDFKLACLYRNALCFVMMSLYEGFGFPVLEAMKCGTAVIVSDNSSLPEIIGKSGIKVPPKDQQALVESLHKLYSSTTLQQQMYQESLEQAKKFSWQNFISELIKLL